MSKTTDTLYERPSVNAKRLETDKLFTDTRAEFTFYGNIDKMMRFVEDFQLLDAENWARFVDQFRLRDDSKNNGWRGEYWGKMMRGAAFVYSYTRDEELYRVIRASVEDMLTAEDEFGRISTYNVENEFGGWDLWCRKYVLLGMQYFYEICGEDELKKRLTASMCHQCDYLISKLGPVSEGKLPVTSASGHWRGLNSASILEPVVRLYDLTGEKRYLDFASEMVAEGGTSVCNIYELAYRDTTDPYQYPITKAYEMMSCFEGLLEYYRATGIEKYKQAVIRFGRRLMNSDITIIGSAGCTHEQLDHSAARQTDTAFKGVMQETCVTVTWMKLCWQLLMLTGDSVFADRFEQALYNAYLGAVNTEKIVGDEAVKQWESVAPVALPFDSYSALLPGMRGRGVGGLQLMADGHYYGCCACIGAAGIGMAHKVAVMQRDDGIAMNLYIAGSVVTRTPSGGELKLDTSTLYPADGKIEITVGVDAGEEFTLALRIPDWSARTSLYINGERLLAENGYTEIRRVWSNGDRIVLTLDMRAKVIHAPRSGKDILMTGGNWAIKYFYPTVVEATPEAKFHIALRRGPLVLARDARLDGTVDEAVDIAYDDEGYVALEPSAKAGFDHIVEFSVPQTTGRHFTVVDYASAGKTWDESSKYCCWMPTREYWKK